MGTNIVAYMVNGVTNQYSTTEMLDEVSEGGGGGDAGVCAGL